MDFEGPLPSSSGNSNLLIMVDKYSWYSMAFPCPDVTAETVIKVLTQVFSFFDLPELLHSD